MITLKKERSYVKVNTWDEITELNGFRHKLNHKEHQLDEIIGRYIFSEKTSCGLTNCNTPHNKGYIVSTKDGLITNIGKDCGKTYFDVDFHKMAKTFDAAVAEHNHRSNVLDFLFHIEHRKEEISSLRKTHLGADWLNATKKTLTKTNSLIPPAITVAIQRMIRSRNPSIIKPRLATNKEIDIIRASGSPLKTPHYIDEQIGSFRGSESLYKENDIRELLILDLQQNLAALEKLDIKILSQTDLKRWSTWCNDYQQKYQRACEIIENGKNLVVTENLVQFLPLVEDQREQKLFKSFASKNRQRM